RALSRTQSDNRFTQGSRIASAGKREYPEGSRTPARSEKPKTRKVFAPAGTAKATVGSSVKDRADNGSGRRVSAPSLIKRILRPVLVPLAVVALGVSSFVSTPAYAQEIQPIMQYMEHAPKVATVTIPFKAQPVSVVKQRVELANKKYRANGPY